jgi:hypothetical protein
MKLREAPWSAAARRRLEIMPRTMAKAAASRRSPRCLWHIHFYRATISSGYGKPYPYNRQKSVNNARRMAANVLAYCAEGEKERVIAQDG